MGIILSEIEAIFFDIDGTLSNSDDHIIEEITRRIRFLRFFWKEQNLQKFARASVSLAMTGFNISYHLVDRLGIDDFIVRTFPHKKKNRDRESFDKDHSLITGVEEMLQDLHRKYRLGIISARSDSGVLDFIQKFSLQQYFDVLVSGQTCYYSKPFPHPLLFAADAMHVQPERCLMVGDTVVDILAGKAAGMRTIGVLSGFGTQKELKKAAADFILKSIADLRFLLS
ncbi:MAG TPA: hypothetical protein DCK95_00755 [Anaerolineaceae bacterium]|nr:hypothetical protein [Anaerolineaceae bacterium]